jgi:hypothetical protein
MKAIKRGLQTMLAAVLAAGCTSDKSGHPPATTEAGVKPPAPLFEGLGNHHHPITTTSRLAQRYFDQGLTLLYGFNHAEAIRSFDAVALLDPDCAMAHWGIAYAYGPNINMPMDEKAVPKAWDALQKAVALKSKASAKEQAYIDALAKRYLEHPPQPRAPLDQAYAEAMREVAKQYPQDLDAQTLFAEALMDTSPWRYWQEDGTMKPSAKEALAAVESVLSQVRQHPGADHLHIHLVEAGPHPEKAEASADRLGKFAPTAGHLVHMPSHIYVRIGRYHDASYMNELASKADESYLAQCKQQGMYPGGYYPHNVHFLWFATALEGRSADCIAAAKKVGDYTTELRCGAIEGARQRYLPLLAYARFGQWESILKTAQPTSEYPYDLAMWHYARGLALAATGKATQARAEHAALVELTQSDKIKAMDNPYFPGTKILAIANEVLAGKVAAADGSTEEALKHLEEGVKLEDAMPYMEPAYWYYPVRQSVGAALLKGGKAAEAERIFRADLSKTPANGWSLFGLERALRAQEKVAAADQAERDFKKAWSHADTKLDLTWF